MFGQIPPPRVSPLELVDLLSTAPHLAANVRVLKVRAARFGAAPDAAPIFSNCLAACPLVRDVRLDLSRAADGPRLVANLLSALDASTVRLRALTLIFNDLVDERVGASRAASETLGRILCRQTRVRHLSFWADTTYTNGSAFAFFAPESNESKTTFHLETFTFVANGDAPTPFLFDYFTRRPATPSETSLSGHLSFAQL